MNEAVPFSAGVHKPKRQPPPNACDCHFHIFDARFPMAANAIVRPPEARVPDYRRLQERLGVGRGVIVAPSTYGTDNACTLDAMAHLGKGVRGVAVVDTSVSDAELRRLDESGICGIRFNTVRPGVTTAEMIEPLSRRIADLGWHVQIYMDADEIAERAELFARLPVPVVFDHLGHIPQPDGRRHPAFAVIARLLWEGRSWVKISGLYHDTKLGPPHYADVGELAQAYIRLAPERIVWGTDWPHPSPRGYGTPDDALMFDLAAEWAGSEAVWHRILVDNPEALYGFPRTSEDEGNHTEQGSVAPNQ